ncbi:MAG: class I SAM-dependent methyltransferase [Ktedonobacteraceae bacterium]
MIIVTLKVEREDGWNSNHPHNSVNSYYRGRYARQYNTRWRTYTEKTLAAARTLIDGAALQRVLEQHQRPPRMLDVACGTGILIQQMLQQMPNMEAYGIDASADMLTQASESLQDHPQVHLELVDLNAGGLAHSASTLPVFDLITCTNVLHDIADPRTFFAQLRTLLAPGGQLIIEDFAPRQPILLWAVFERLLQWIETAPVHALTVDEAHALCESAGLRVTAQNTFAINWFWHGWVLRAI